jgi:ribosomal protein S18 acetylase RimI-like enzyme
MTQLRRREVRRPGSPPHSKLLNATVELDYATAPPVRLFRPHPRHRPHPKISLAGAAHATELTALYRAAWSGCRGVLTDRFVDDAAPSADEVATWLAGGFEIYRATIDGALAGTMRLSFPAGTCLIDRVAVAPAMRGRGVGRALTDHAVSRARRAGVGRVWLQAPLRQPGALEMFRGAGFREAGEVVARYWNEPLTLLEMKL